MIRDAVEADIARMHAIFAEAVETSTSSYEKHAPTAAEYAARFHTLRRGGYRWLAAERGGQLAGFAYDSAFRDRWGYRFAVENSVYVDAAQRGRGVGRALLEELIARARADGRRSMIAVIGDAQNLATIRLHRACGFSLVGVAQGLGEKFGRELDLVIMQRRL